MKKTDFLGNEYGPGDFVIYGQASGRCINMVKGQVVDIKDNGKVTVQPIAGSRWSSHSKRSYTVDNRTGKRIDPWSGNGKHIKEEAYYQTSDGTKYSMEDVRKMHYRDRLEITRPGNYVATVFHDYVETREEGIKPVTISVTENIVKFADGELPTEG